MVPDPNDALRSRLATESSLAQKQRELAEANTRIVERARVLSEEVIVRRNEAAEARSEAMKARHRHVEAMSNLRRARSETHIAERRLWTSLESVADGFAVFDREGRVVAANPAFFGPYEGMDCVKLGISYGELVDIAIEEGLVDPGDMGPRDWARWMKGRWESRTIPPVTIRFWSNQFVRLTERRTPDGDVVMVGTNITRQIRRQKVLEEARRRAEAANRAKSAFLANMSHEIRTPMNGVLAMADLVGEGPLTEDQRLCLDTIRSSGEALLVIINDVLDYSKIEAQKLKVEPHPFDLESTVSEVATLLMPAAREKGLNLVVDYDIFLPTRFVGDHGRIRQILMNLVGNAVKFTHVGHVLIRIVGLPDPRPEHYRLHVTVEDTGIGIEDDLRDHIFGEFNQVQSELTRQFDGTGLGLSISRRLVALMDGDMWVDSEPGKGSVFGFRLTLPTDGAGVHDLCGIFDGRRAVFWDPNPMTREIMVKQLMALGLRPECVEEPGQIAGLSLRPCDLVIVGDEEGLNGSVRIGSGPDFARNARTVARPLLRETMLAELTSAVEAAGDVADGGDPATEAQTAPGPVTADVPVPVSVLPAPETPAARAPEPVPAPIEVEAPPATAPLPVEPDAEAADDTPEPVPVKEQTESTAPALRKVRVLCAEDNKTNRLVLARFLKGLDIDLRIVENGREAVEAFRAERPDIVFTDISMPEMDGKQAARAMRRFAEKKKLPHVPIVAMTAHAVEGNEEEILAAGIDHYLTKPLKKHMLVKRILAAAPDDAAPPLPEAEDE